METFRLMAGTACFLGIVITMFSSLYPSDKFAKQMKIIFSLIFIISVIKPVAQGKFDFPELSEAVSASTNYYSSLNDNTYDYIIRSVESSISFSLETALNKKNIYPLKIQTSVNISDSGSISINEVKLVLDDMSVYSEAVKCIREAAESDVNVTAEVQETE